MTAGKWKRDAARQHGAGGRRVAEAAERRKRITVIDDHNEFLNMIAEVLSERYEVVTLAGENIAPDDIVDSGTDLLIVDLRLGARELQGVDIVTLVRAHRDLRHIPIVICSADAAALNGKGEELLSVGNVALLAKPFLLAEVEELVARGISGGYSSTAAAAR
jgi:CheY-like chemotaxis protein